MHTPSPTNACNFFNLHNAYHQSFQFPTYIFSADITPEMLKLCAITKVNVVFLVLVYVLILIHIEMEKAKMASSVSRKGV